MANDQNKTEISYLPRSWGPSQRSRSKMVQEDDHSMQYAGSEEPSSIPDEKDQRTQGKTPDYEGRGSSRGERSKVSSETNQSLLITDSAHDSDETGVTDPCLCFEKKEDPDSSVFDFVEETQDAPDGSDVSERISVKVCGIRFGYAGKIYHFESGSMELEYGDWVVVKTEKGLGLGQIALRPFEKQIHVSQLEGLRKVIRKGGKVDLYQKQRCAEREAEAHSYCLDKIEELSLPMKLVAVECFFDGSKYVFYFTAEGRVDFRELVKQLVARFPVRIEMRQIGVRHEAKMTGGLGGCGQELCCSRFLTDFRPVSVKMAKNQNLSLNPTKISGVCGRLMCCLGYEHDTYEEFSRGLPKVGRMVKTETGEGLVIKHNPLEETILIKIDDETQIEVKRQDIVCEFEPVGAKKEDLSQASKGSKKGTSRQAEEDLQLVDNESLE